MITNPVINKIREAIIGTEFENNVFVAGGFVRDYVMGGNSKDIDLVVSLPDGGVQLATYLYVALDTSKPVIFNRFGTARMVIDNNEIDMVMTRKESYNFKTRNPLVQNGTIKDDVLRRDFTINALLYDITNNKIIDLVNGIHDIRQGIIRTTTNSKVIFAEDPLRIMRAIRFSAQFGFKIEKKTWNSIKNSVHLLDNISVERIRDELNKILVSEYLEIGYYNLLNSGIMEYIIPLFKIAKTINNQGKHHTKNLIDHTLEVMLNTKPTIEHRLSAWLHDIGKVRTMDVDSGGDVHFRGHQHVSRVIANAFMRKYKYTNEQIHVVTTAIDMHMGFIQELTAQGIRRGIRKNGKETFLFCLDLAEADSRHADRLKIVSDVRKFVDNDEYVVKIVRQNLPVDGNMIMDRFDLKPSKVVGNLLNVEQELLINDPSISVEDIWIELEKKNFKKGL